MSGRFTHAPCHLSLDLRSSPVPWAAKDSLPGNLGSQDGEIQKIQWIWVKGWITVGNFTQLPHTGRSPFLIYDHLEGKLLNYQMVSPMTYGGQIINIDRILSEKEHRTVGSGEMTVEYFEQHGAVAGPNDKPMTYSKKENIW